MSASSFILDTTILSSHNYSNELHKKYLLTFILLKIRRKYHISVLCVFIMDLLFKRVLLSTSVSQLSTWRRGVSRTLTLIHLYNNTHNTPPTPSAPWQECCSLDLKIMLHQINRENANAFKANKFISQLNMPSKKKSM